MRSDIRFASLWQKRMDVRRVGCSVGENKTARGMSREPSSFYFQREQLTASYGRHYIRQKRMRQGRIWRRLHQPPAARNVGGLRQQHQRLPRALGERLQQLGFAG